MMTTQEDVSKKKRAKEFILKLFEEKEIAEQTKNTALELLHYIPVWTHSFFKVSEGTIGQNIGSVFFEYSLSGIIFVIKVRDTNIFVNGEKYDTFHGLYEASNAVKLQYQEKHDTMCLFTGAFNPPTIAHYHMIDTVMEAKKEEFDYVVFATSNQKFLDKKQAKTGGWAYSEEQRVKMLLAMTRDCPNVLVYGVEQGYTYDVLCAVKAKYNPQKLYFVLGSDKLQEIGRWGHHDALLSEFCFYVAQRNDDLGYIKSTCKELFKNTQFIIGTHNNDYKDVSATQVRDAIKNNTTYDMLVTDYVREELERIKTT